MKTKQVKARYVDNLVALPAKGRCTKGRNFNRKLLWQLAYYIGDAFCHKGFPMDVPLEKAYKQSVEEGYVTGQMGILISIHFATDKASGSNIQVEVIDWKYGWLRQLGEGECAKAQRIKEYQDLALGEQADIAILISGNVKRGAKLVNYWTSEKVRQHKDWKASCAFLVSEGLGTLQNIGALKDLKIMDKESNIHFCEDQGNVLFSILSCFFPFDFMDMRD